VCLIDGIPELSFLHDCDSTTIDSMHSCVLDLAAQL